MTLLSPAGGFVVLGTCFVVAGILRRSSLPIEPSNPPGAHNAAVRFRQWLAAAFRESLYPNLVPTFRETTPRSRANGMIWVGLIWLAAAVVALILGRDGT